MGEKILLKRVRPGEDNDINIPAYQSQGAAGLDLEAAVKNDTIIAQGQICLIPTGLAAAIPLGYEGQLRPRSGLALKEGLTLINSPGTVDSDYRGEIMLAMINLGSKDVTIKRGQRVAQMVIHQVSQVEIAVVEELPQTSRGAGGFGSTKV